MGLSGSLRTLSLAEIFQTLNRSQATGVLRLSGPEGGRDVVFQGGEVIQVLHTGKANDHSVVERLVALGMVDEAAMMNATTVTGSGGFSAVESLVDVGVLDEAAVTEAMTEQMTDEIYELFTWTSANFIFKEAGDADPEASRLVEESSKHPLQMAVSTLLMEGARRVDEWREICEFLPGADDIPEVMADAVDALAQVSTTYPGRVITPLINGYRSFEEMYREAAVPRMEIQFFIHEVMSAGYVKILSVDEMIVRAQQMQAQGRDDLTAQLARRALGLDRTRQDAVELLAGSLENAGDQPEASGCYGQLALTYLDDGRGHDAVDMAQRACDLNPASRTQTMLLVRCLVDVGAADRAENVLLDLARKQLAEGSPDEARTTCQKVLGLNSECEEAKRELAKIYKQDGGQVGDDEIVVCIQCGEPNPRSNETCQACGEGLHLTCLSCGRVVAASDSLCIFCGADPHAGAEATLVGAAPGTELILKSRATVGGSSQVETGAWEAEARRSIHEARHLEDQERYAEALDIWKQLAREHVDMPELDAHVRDLEALVHDRQIERLIERGHQLRDQRRYRGAMQSYRQALRCLPQDDPRIDRLQELVDHASKGNQMSTLAYGLAFLCLLASGWIVVEPHFAAKKFVGEIEPIIADVRQATTGESMLIWGTIRDYPASYAAKAEEAGIEDDQQVQLKLMELKNYHRVAGSHLAGVALRTVQTAIEAGQADNAEDDLGKILELFGKDFHPERVDAMRQRIGELRKEAKLAEASRKAAPEAFTKAVAFREQGQLDQALNAFSMLVDSTVDDIGSKAKAQVAELRERQGSFDQAVAANRSLRATDLTQAMIAWQELSAEAKAWGRGGEWSKDLAELQGSLTAAKQAYAALGASEDVAQLKTFLITYAAAPEAGVVRSRLAKLEKAQAIHAQAVADHLSSYRKAREANNLEKSFIDGGRLFSRFPKEAAAAKVEIPTVVSCGVADGLVTFNGKKLGTTDQDGTFIWWHGADVRGSLQLACAGFEPATIELSSAPDTLELIIALQREQIWSKSYNQAVTGTRAHGADHALVQAGRQLVKVAIADGAVAWQADLGEDDGLGNARSLVALATIDDEGGVTIPTADNRILQVSPAGAELARIDVDMQILDRPMRFYSEVLGRDFLAVSGGGLRIVGNDGKVRSSSASGFIAGPMIVQSTLDTILVVADLTGELVWVNASDLSEVRRRPMGQVINVAPFMQVDDKRFITLLNGSSLVCYQVDETKSSKRWEYEIRGELRAGPVLRDGVVRLATADRIISLRANSGAVLKEITPTGEALGGVDGDAAGTVYGCRLDDGTFQVRYEAHQDGKPSWFRTVPAACRSVLLTKDTVLIGCDNGSLIAVNR